MSDGRNLLIDAKRSEKRLAQDRFLEHFVKVGGKVEDAIARSGVGRSSFYRWRKEMDFATRLDKATREAAQVKAKIYGKDLVPFDPFREMPEVPGLVEFRQKVFGFPSISTQEAFAKAYDDETNLVIFWIAPASAGKDVTAMQAVCHAAARGVARIGCLMENEKQAKKRIDAYLDPYFTDDSLYERAPAIPGATVPELNFVKEWGPWKYDPKFRLPDGSRPPATKWQADQKWFVGRTTPMADPSLWAVGLGGSIAGARIDLLVCSDLFTVENQRSPAFRQEQLDLINGTVESRLDEGGRIIFLNHHVAKRGASNLIALMDSYIGDAPIVTEEGDYTKYSNGVAVIKTPALTVNENGDLQSYWPERFPVHGEIVMPDGTRHVADTLEPGQLEELQAAGGKRIRGLLDRKRRLGDLFELIYQQNPTVSAYGDFTAELLDACDDPTRTLGQYRPGETLILGVDPARSGGAAWVLWAVSLNTATFSVVDYWTGNGLGFAGMREKLIREPVEKWKPRHMVWEINLEADTPQHPDAQAVLRQYHVQFHGHHTHHNRIGGKRSVPAMAEAMRDGLIKFPAATEGDRLRLRELKDHFLAWEAAGYTERRRTTGRSRIPDDGCMAAWFGWGYGMQLVDSQKSNRRGTRQGEGVSQAVAEAFSEYRL